MSINKKKHLSLLGTGDLKFKQITYT